MMYDLRIKNNKISLQNCDILGGEDAKEKELIYGSNEDCCVHVLIEQDSGIYVDACELNTVYINDNGYIILYDCVDYHNTKIHVDPNLYYLEADYIKDLETMTLTIKRKDENNKKEEKDK